MANLDPEKIIAEVKAGLRTKFDDLKFDYSGKVAIVTGARTGIGLCAATAFAEAGATVVMVGRNEPVAEAQALRDKGFDAVSLKGDMSVEEDVKHMVDFTTEKYGRLDFCFNNAGIMKVARDIDEIPVEEMREVININQMSVMMSMHYEMAYLKKQFKEKGIGGSIVNCSSTSGLIGVSGRTPYVASKHAIAGLTKTVAQEAAKYDINVNAVGPGNVWSAMLEDLFRDECEAMMGYVNQSFAGRVGSGEETAMLVLYLCSSAARYITGTLIPIDGGITCA